MNRPLILLAAALTATMAVYWPGLSSPFLLDDGTNLAPIWRWLAGETGLAETILDNRSGPLGRPLSMLSFAATAAVWGESAYAFKAVNLAIHLLTGVALYALLGRLFGRDPLFRSNRLWWAAGVSAVWLLHPLFASTVLYAVQRMALLSALFTVLTLLAFVVGRQRIQDTPTAFARAVLFFVVPALTAAAALSKETGLLALFLCGLIEWIYFRPPAGEKRPKEALWFSTAFVGLPVAAGLLLMLVKPGFFFDGYLNRPFGPIERLLTECRVLFDYVGSLLLPAGRQFSLYRDDYLVSSGLLTPLTTLWALLGWVAALAGAWMLRGRLPGLIFGLGFFLIGHALESSIFPLLIYFEHRNYLPGIGILVAVSALLAWAGHALRGHMDHPRPLLFAAGLGLLLALSFATFARSLAWQDPMHLLEQSLARYPDSRLARIEMAAQIMNSEPRRDVSQAVAQYRHLQSLDLPSTRGIGFIGEMAIDCFARGATDPALLSKAFAQKPESLQADYFTAVESLAEIARDRDCEGVQRIALAQEIAELADGAALPQGHRIVWQLRFRAAQLFAAEQRDREALEQAELAWRTGAAGAPVGMLMVAVNIRLGQYGTAKRLLDELDTMVPTSDRVGRELIDDYRQAIEDASDGISLSRGFGRM